MSKQLKFIVTTPVAEIGYAWLRKPDTAFNKEGDYKADFFLTPDEAREFCRMVESDPRAMVKGRAAKLKGTKVDGMIKFKSKQHATIKVKKAGVEEVVHIQPKLFYIVDGETVPYPDDAPAPFGGSKGEIEVEVIPFEGFGGGLSLRLRAIRLHEVVGGSTGGSTGAWADTPEGYTSGSKEYVAADGPEAGTDAPEVEEDDEDEDDRW